MSLFAALRWFSWIARDVGYDQVSLVDRQMNSSPSEWEIVAPCKRHACAAAWICITLLVGTGLLIPVFVGRLNGIPNLPADVRPWPRWLLPAWYSAAGAYLAACLMAAPSGFRSLRTAGRVGIGVAVVALLGWGTSLGIAIDILLEIALYVVTAMFAAVVVRVAILGATVKNGAPARVWSAPLATVGATAALATALLTAKIAALGWASAID